MLIPDLVFHLASFNYDGKGARDVGLTCRCRRAILCLIVSSVIDGGNLTFLPFSKKVVVLLFTVGQNRRSSFITSASVNVRKT